MTNRDLESSASKQRSWWRTIRAVNSERLNGLGQSGPETPSTPLPVPGSARASHTPTRAENIVVRARTVASGDLSPLAFHRFFCCVQQLRSVLTCAKGKQDRNIFQNKSAISHFRLEAESRTQVKIHY